MLGFILVCLWLFIFGLISYFLIKYLKINNFLLIIIFVWSFFMIFISIFQFMILFSFKYLENKSKYYYINNKCYWNEKNSIYDMFSNKMYMDLYADYSLSDKRYSENIANSEGGRFVYIGEVVHGSFCIVMSCIIMYLFFFNFNKKSIYLFSIINSSIQIALITWYLVSVFIELQYNKNNKFWWPPLLWNILWIIFPLYIMYFSFIKLNH
jgi:hypothetical protein